MKKKKGYFSHVTNELWNDFQFYKHTLLQDTFQTTVPIVKIHQNSLGLQHIYFIFLQKLLLIIYIENYHLK